MTTEEIIEIIEHSGIRATANRIRIYKEIAAQNGTFSLGDMEEVLDSLDKSTIFRTLLLFNEHHLIHSMEDGSGQIKYCACSHPADCEDEEEHCHFYCTQCHKSYCLEEIAIKKIRLPEGFEMSGINYVIKGLCASCTEKSERKCYDTANKF